MSIGYVYNVYTTRFKYLLTYFSCHRRVRTEDEVSLSLSLSPPPFAPQPSLGLGLLRNLLPLKMAEFLGGFSTVFFFTG
jgi:hypothetical protein